MSGQPPQQVPPDAGGPSAQQPYSRYQRHQYPMANNSNGKLYLQQLQPGGHTTVQADAKPPPSPVYPLQGLGQIVQKPASANASTSNYLEVPTEKLGNFLTTYRNTYVVPAVEVKLPSSLTPAFEDSLNRQRVSNSPLHSFTRLNNIRKKSISEISLILEVIRSAARPPPSVVRTASEIELATESPSALPATVRGASASPYAVRQAKHAAVAVRPSLNDAVVPRRTSFSANNISALAPAIPSPALVAVSPFTSASGTTTKRAAVRPLSPTLSRISLFLRQQKRGRSRGFGGIRWDRLSPHNIQRQIAIGRPSAIQGHRPFRFSKYV